MKHFADKIVKLLLSVIMLNSVAYAQSTITIGTDATKHESYVFSGDYKYSRSQHIYLASEVGATGSITKIRTYVASYTGVNNGDIANVEVLIGTTTNTTLTSSWASLGSIVWSGNFNYKPTTGWFEFDITDFSYNGGSDNLIIEFRHTDGAAFNQQPEWRYSGTSGAVRSAYGVNNTSLPATATAAANIRPNIQLEFSAGSVPPPSGGITNVETLHASQRVKVGNSIILDAPNNDLYTDGTLPLLLQSKGTFNNNTIINANNTGNVGIGLTNPSEKLDINGTIRLAALTGSGTRIMQTDNNGKLVPLIPGTPTQVLLGDGTWGSVPTSTAWSLTGNSGTDEAVNFIGTLDAKPLIFKANNVEHMRIAIDGEHPGNVGIGTDHPHKKLHIYTEHPIPPDPCATDPANCPQTHQGLRLEDKYINGGSSTWDIEPLSPLSGTDSRLSIGLVTATQTNRVMIIRSNGNIGIGQMLPLSRLVIRGAGTTSTTSALNVTKNNGATMLFVRDDGNVGIGTTSPDQQLHVNGIGRFGNANGRVDIGFNSVHGYIDSDQDLLIGYYSQKQIFIGPGNVISSGVFKSENNTFLAINTGAVGVGTEYVPAGYKLAIHGNVIAEEVNVKLRANWPDYVFSPSYRLMSLSELENYIKTNKHLPEMPSDKEVEKNGINTSEIITKLLKQQEELTLYIIEQNKRIEQLEKQILKK